MKNLQGLLRSMRTHSAVLGLAMVLLTTAVALGARRSPAKETALLAEQITANMAYRSQGKVSAIADGCRLQINFESFQASFDLPIKDTTVAESETEGGIVIRNTHMTRKIRNRAPEPFDRLSVKLNRTNVKTVMKSFEDAIAACASERLIASNTRSQAWVPFPDGNVLEMKLSEVSMRELPLAGLSVLTTPVLKVLCIVGIHDDEAQYVEQETCVVRKKCRRCGREHHRLEHAGFGAWHYEAAGGCRTRRECTRCGAWETGLRHQGGESREVRQAGSVCHCSRCRSPIGAGK